MKSFYRMQVGLIFLLTVAGFTVAGCGSRGTKGPATGKQAAPGVDSSEIAVNWCVEHGVPEDICAQCNAKVAAEYKQKGDWCNEHNRPESQCFLCNPKLADKFAAEYEVKYGKKPPKPAGI
jgi:hypothetical protein